MKYSDLPIGVEIYTVREPFNDDPAATLRRVREMGYDGVEFYDTNYNKSPELLRGLLEENGLRCYGILTNWEHLQPDTIQKTLEYNRILGNRTLAIGSLYPELTKDKATLYGCIDYFNVLLHELREEGFSMGYHNHAADFKLVEGKTIWDHVFENTPREFNMVLDTGNAAMGGGDSIGSIRKFPGRQEWMHIKPYSDTKCFERGTDAMIGEDDFDWPELLRTCVEEGGCKVLTIEYGTHTRFQPFYGAYLCYENLKKILREMDEGSEKA